MDHQMKGVLQLANKQTNPVVNFSFTNSTRATETGSSTGGLTAPEDYATITSLRSTLSTFDELTYTDEVLDQMTVNDMVFAVRGITEPDTISDYHPTQTARS